MYSVISVTSRVLESLLDSKTRQTCSNTLWIQIRSMSLLSFQIAWRKARGGKWRCQHDQGAEKRNAQGSGRQILEMSFILIGCNRQFRAQKNETKEKSALPSYFRFGGLVGEISSRIWIWILFSSTSCSTPHMRVESGCAQFQDIMSIEFTWEPSDLPCRWGQDGGLNRYVTENICGHAVRSTLSIINCLRNSITMSHINSFSGPSNGAYLACN